jgi:membrane protein implicated in regulation of membrane protease activity
MKRGWQRLSAFGAALRAGISVAAAAVPLALLPLATWVKVVVFAVVVIVALIAVVPQARMRIDDDDDVVHRSVLKVASVSRNVRRADLRGDQLVIERNVPFSRPAMDDELHVRDGIWHRDGQAIGIIVNGYNLILHPTGNAIWKGVERYADQAQEFVGAIIDPDPIRNGHRWVGVKLGESGTRRIVVASDDGRLVERDAFDEDGGWAGAWHVDADGALHISIDHWSLVVRRWQDIYLGTETGSGADEPFAFVRADGSF